MSFDTIFFIFTWLPCCLLLYYVLPKRWRLGYLLVVSYLFYAWGNLYQALFLLFLTGLHIQTVKLLDKLSGKSRRALFVEVLVFDVFALCFFKYYGAILNELFAREILQVNAQLPYAPLGISFYMFSLIGYLIDSYRGQLPVKKNSFQAALYIAFFPKLLMGPICRYQQFVQQLEDLSFQPRLFDTGASRFIIGLAQKVVLANTFAQLFQQLQAAPLTMLGAWGMTLAFTLQLYFDFQGYSQMAIGLSNLLGFTMPENFHYPYLACSIKDFWNRWHITLSHWFRDYVYFPLGGSRVSRQRHILNLMIVWSLTGLWHGANLTFLVWGCYYGVLLILEKYIWYPLQQTLPKGCNWAITLFLIMIGWVFFYSSSMSQACQILGSMFGSGNIASPLVISVLEQYAGFLLIGIVCATPLMEALDFLLNMYLNRWYYLLRLAIMFGLLLICIAFLVGNTYQSFLYFAF